MSIEFTKIVKGIMLEGVDTDPATTEKGAMWYNTTDKRIKADVGDAGKQEIVTTDEPQNLTNKNITGSTFEVDADTSNVSNLETDNFKAGVIDTDPTLAADSDTVIPTQKAVKQFVADSVATKDEASEISYDNTTSGLTATDVQAAVDEVEGRLDTEEQNLALHEADTTTHGTTGDIVGTTDVQDLSNKAIIDPSRLDVYKDTTSNLETYAGTASNGQLCFDTDKKKMFQIVDNKLKAVGAGGATIEVNQTAHGFNLLDAVYFNGSAWQLAKADDEDTTATHIISEVSDVDNFIGMQFGEIEAPSHGKTVGAYYFLSITTAGLGETTEPTSGFSCPLFFVPDADRIIAMVYRPSVIGNQVTLDELADVSASTPSDGQGLVWNNANSAWEAIDIATQTEFDSHVGSTSAHGVGTVAGVDEVQTLTNKTLTTPTIDGGNIDNANISSPKITTPTQLDVKQDSIANLETYATTATNGQLCFATDEKKMFQVVDGELKSVGGASVGDSSIYSFIDADDIADTKWDKSGLTNSTFTLDTTTPLAGKKSYLFTSTTTSAGESVSYTIDIPVRSQDSDFHKLKFPYQYNGTKGNVTIEMYDVTNSESINTVEIDPTVNRMDLIFSKPTGCTQVKFIINCVTGEDSVFELDQIGISDAAYGYGSATISETIRITDFFSESSFVDANIIEYAEGNDLIKAVHTTSGLEFFASSVCELTVLGEYRITDSDNYGAALLYEDGVEVIRNSENESDIRTNAVYGVRLKYKLLPSKRYKLKIMPSGFDSDGTGHSIYLTATAQSDKILFEDEREQAHFKGGAGFGYSTGVWASTGTSYSILTVDSGTFNVPALDGDVEWLDAQVPRFSIKNTKLGYKYKVILQAFIYSNNTDSGSIALYDGVKYYEGGLVHADARTNSPAVFYIDGTGSDIQLEIHGKHANGKVMIYNNNEYRSMNLYVEMLPPLSQASTPTVLAVNASEENVYGATLANSTSGSITDSDPVSNWVEFVTHVEDGKNRWKLNTDIFSVFPKLTVAGNDIAGSYNAYLYKETFPYFVTVSSDSTNTQTNSGVVDVIALKSGADRSPAKAYCVDSKQVVKEQVCSVRVNDTELYQGNEIDPSTSYKIRNLSFIEGDVFASVSNDILTLPSGKYVFRVPLYLVDGCRGYYLKVEKDGVQFLERYVLYHSDNGRFGAEVTFYIETDNSCELTFWTKVTDAAGTKEGIYPIEIRKLL